MCGDAKRAGVGRTVPNCRAQIHRNASPPRRAGLIACARITAAPSGGWRELACAALEERTAHDEDTTPLYRACCSRGDGAGDGVHSAERLRRPRDRQRHARERHDRAGAGERAARHAAREHPYPAGHHAHGPGAGAGARRPRRPRRPPPVTGGGGGNSGSGNSGNSGELRQRQLGQLIASARQRHAQLAVRPDADHHEGRQAEVLGQQEARAHPRRQLEAGQVEDEDLGSDALPEQRRAGRLEPDLHGRATRTRAGHERPQLRDPAVPRPAVPAADLPGRGHPVRDPLGGAGGDQRDRDRLRAQPQRLLGRRRRLDAVPPLDLEDLGRGRQPRRPQGPLQPGRRDLRRGALPQGRRRGEETSTERSSPTTTRAGTSTP